MPCHRVRRPPKRDELTELIDGSRRAHLSPYKIPEVTHFVPEIPRTGSGKSLRFKLVEMLNRN